ncbi:MAG: undecaprenyl-phosphate galactose phosphotransferase WbaP [Bryobacteraceae bacterium]|nr:undecaprenyl-phosphate galactose phosphotransferase WbaP [Bryobacteraceae bacterium]
MTQLQEKTATFWQATTPPLVFDRSRPALMVGALIASDTLALTASVAISLFWKMLIAGPIDVEGYLRLLPFLGVFLGAFAAQGLYSDVSVSTPEELRRATISSVLLFLILGSATVGLRGGTHLITGTLLLSIVHAVALVPLFRAFTRAILSSKPWWGYTAVVFGGGAAGRSMVASLIKDPGFGLKPRAIVDEDASYGHCLGVPVVSSEEVAAALRSSGRKAYAVMVMTDVSHPRLHKLLESNGDVFSHVLVLPELLYSYSQFATSKSVGGRWGLELRRRELDAGHLHLKRMLDLTLVLVAAPLVAPLSLLLALVVKLTSKGPAFFGQRRIGRQGRDFKAWKFRTMVTNGDEVLAKHLAADPVAREEWERTRKLRNDPRVTRIGRLLRRTSLDELPQLWNVLRGEMSLVGPRPIVAAEVPLYGNAFGLYKLMPAGLTGLWQVSGRNDTTYEERVTLDSFYARNWSVWLDLYILSRTIGAVLGRNGAY